jgi:predicted metal-dependent enzyme (double-stranded beta helix superfamily)
MTLADTLITGQIGPLELGQLVGSIAERPERWRDIVRFDAGERWYHRLELTDDLEVWLLSWFPGQGTGFHDHGEAVGAFTVAQGELTERLVPARQARARSRVYRTGEARPFGFSHIHDVVNLSSAPAVSVHAYSPPLTAMRRYELTGTGLLHTGTDQAELGW